MDINDLKIDLVYLWCDGNDSVWQKRKEKTQQAFEHNIEKKAIQKCRFVQSNELLYSLRSVENYAPWINKIFIVTDNQVPKWLNINHPKIKIIDHKEIMPPEVLPCFNSEALETRLPFIKDLSEYFLYANDDIIFWNTVEKSFFFNRKKQPICRMGSKIKNKTYINPYGKQIVYTYNLAKEKYNNLNTPYFPHHNVDAYRKSYFLDCIKNFQKEYDVTTAQPFRKACSVQRIIVQYYMLANNLAELKLIKKPWYNPFKQPESQYIKCKIRRLKHIKNSTCKLLCINDSEKTTDKDRTFMQEILKEKFPQKSQFEL